ncbi:hypothetical protein [Streptomyces sp. NPDC056061]|uniref:hypothetical protein n=1 Tax=Streptomyces sp. NPDC056061 TaxID=3345700 RepID=UPI0035E24F02
MRRQILHSTGRRGTLIAASAAVLCLGGALAACGGGAADGGYVAVGAAGAGPERTPSGAVAPSGKVTLLPLDGKTGGDGRGRPSPGASGASGMSDVSGASDVPAGGRGAGAGGPASGRNAGEVGNSGGTGDSGGAGDGSSGSADPGAGPGGTSGGGSGGDSGGTSGGGSGGGAGGDPTGPVDPGPSTPAGPAVVVIGAVERAAADERRCQKVGVEFRNTGGSAAQEGTVTFAVHVIGGLGIDWATVETSAPLPTPIDAGAARTKTYTVCVDAWRVPLGMHVETRDITAVVKQSQLKQP